jgi:hypothetical protein
VCLRECEQQLQAIGTRATARDAEKTAAGNHATAAAAAGAAVAGVGDSRGGKASAGGGSSECINEELTVSRLRRGAGGDLVGGARAAAQGRLCFNPSKNASSLRTAVWCPGGK